MKRFSFKKKVFATTVACILMVGIFAQTAFASYYQSTFYMGAGSFGFAGETRYYDGPSIGMRMNSLNITDARFPGHNTLWVGLYKKTGAFELTDTYISDRIFDSGDNEADMGNQGSGHFYWFFSKRSTISGNKYYTKYTCNDVRMFDY